VDKTVRHVVDIAERARSRTIPVDGKLACECCIMKLPVVHKQRFRTAFAFVVTRAGSDGIDVVPTGGTVSRRHDPAGFDEITQRLAVWFASQRDCRALSSIPTQPLAPLGLTLVDRPSIGDPRFWISRPGHLRASTSGI
jgi:hypothetical protein